MRFGRRCLSQLTSAHASQPEHDTSAVHELQTPHKGGSGLAPSETYSSRQYDVRTSLLPEIRGHQILAVHQSLMVPLALSPAYKICHAGKVIEETFTVLRINKGFQIAF